MIYDDVDMFAWGFLAGSLWAVICMIVYYWVIGGGRR